MDVKHVFHWVREALLRPLEPGSVVVAVSSAAAVRNAPGVGGYAGAKATIRFISSTAAAESQRAELGIQFRCVLPTLTPATELGDYSASRFADMQGVAVASYLERFGRTLTTQEVGKAVLDLARDPGLDQDAYLLTPAGLNPLG
jgi:NAD(P)-dependent dehydrogenase (short-subunit alcohol dehydrogenase family)